MLLLLIRNILATYSLFSFALKTSLTFIYFAIIKTMAEFLINTENIFLKRGICELLIEIANEENISTPFSLQEYSPDTIGQTDVLFTEMETDEHYLCHPFYKKIPVATSVFVFVPSASAVRVDRLPQCLCDATFISMNTVLRSIKNQIAKRLNGFKNQRLG